MLPYFHWGMGALLPQTLRSCVVWLSLTSSPLFLLAAQRLAMRVAAQRLVGHLDTEMPGSHARPWLSYMRSAHQQSLSEWHSLDSLCFGAELIGPAISEPGLESCTCQRCVIQCQRLAQPTTTSGIAIQAMANCICYSYNCAPAYWPSLHQQALEGHTDEIFSAAFNYEGDTIITGACKDWCRGLCPSPYGSSSCQRRLSN
jgi:hypothetical protein